MANSKKSLSVNPIPSEPVNASPAPSGDFVSGLPLAAAIESRVFSFLSERDLIDGKLVLGLSGGLDSMVLLEVLHQLREKIHGALEAVHVHHGLSPNADRWAEFCEDSCAQRKIPLRVERVKVAHKPGESLEANARTRRYEVFKAIEAKAILLAHHLDDQCETFFLRLLRGSGLQGLLAMAQERSLDPRSPIKLLRPFLTITRAQIASYAAVRALSWVEDESNRKTEHTRNFLRLQVLPLIETQFPGYRTTIERTIQNLSSSERVLADQARHDLQRASIEGSLRIGVLREIGPDRALQVLRSYLTEQGLRTPPHDRLEELLRQAFEAKGEAQVAVDVAEGSLRRYRERLFLARNRGGVHIAWQITWRDEQRLVLPSGLGELRFNFALGAGLSQAKLKEAACKVCNRRGGERLRLALNRPSRTLKNLCQEAGVPPWEREQLPLFYCGQQLVWVARIGYASEYLARPDELGVALDWSP